MMNRRKRTLWYWVWSASLIFIVLIAGLTMEDTNTQLGERNQSPSWEHPFGTDWLGRDMLTRTLQGLTLSIGVGLSASAASACFALLLGLLAATMGRFADRCISGLTDLFLSVPHLITLILISFVSGGGAKGIMIGIAVTHWPSLCRVIRAEVLQIRHADYVKISRHLGRSRWWIAFRHIWPHLFPQFFVGWLLIFPHAILHEAAITFLGMGLSPHGPAIGIILSESMRYLTIGMWWLAFFPGICLLMIVRAFDVLGENIRQLLDPYHSHE